MASPSSSNPKDLQAELEKKLADIGVQGQAQQSEALAASLGLPYADLAGLPIDPDALRILSEEESRSSGVALVQTKGETGVAITLDPTLPAAKETLDGLKTRYSTLDVVIVSPSTMNTVWARYATMKTAKTFKVGTITVDEATIASAQEGIKSIDDLSAQMSRKLEDVKKAMREFRSLPQELGLPTAPRQPIHVREEEDRPQPRLDRMVEKGMAVTVGRVRQDPILDIKYTVMGHNTIRGAAGASVLNAELMVKTGRV